MSIDVQPTRREPLINAPLIVVLTAILLVALHAFSAVASPDDQLNQIWVFALNPQRLSSGVGSDFGYSTYWEAGLTFVSTALLHANWMHVLVNAGMLLALGAPPGRYLGASITGAGKWMLVFLAAVVAGSAAYLALAGAGAPPAIGASGGVSGMFAAAFLLHPHGGLRRLTDPDFLRMTAAFAGMNVIIALAGPWLVGGGVAWQAHAGGYVGGALMMMLVGGRPGR